MGLNLLERGELNEEEFGGLVKAEEGFQRVSGVLGGGRWHDHEAGYSLNRVII